MALSSELLKEVLQKRMVETENKIDNRLKDSIEKMGRYYGYITIAGGDILSDMLIALTPKYKAAGWDSISYSGSSSNITFYCKIDYDKLVTDDVKESACSLVDDKKRKITLD